MNPNTVQATTASSVQTTVPVANTTAGIPVGGAGFNGLLSILLDTVQPAQTAADDSNAHSYGPHRADGGNGFADRGTFDRPRPTDAPSEDTPTRGTAFRDTEETPVTFDRNETSAVTASRETGRTEPADGSFATGEGTPEITGDSTAETLAAAQAVQAVVPTDTAPTSDAPAPTGTSNGSTAGEFGLQEPVTSEPFDVQTQRVTQVAPQEQPKAMPEEALQGLTRTGKEVPVSPNGGRPVNLPTQPAATQVAVPGQAVAALAREGAFGSSLHSGTDGGQGGTGNPSSAPKAQGAPAPMPILTPTDVAALQGQSATAGMTSLTDVVAGALHASVVSAETAASSGASAAIAADSGGDSASTGPKAVEGLFTDRSVQTNSRSGQMAEADGRTSAHRAHRDAVISRIAKTIQVSHQEGTSRAKLVLRPAELGTVKVNLVIKDGALSATLQTETAAAKHLIAGNLHELRATLAAHGVEVDSFEVTSRDDSQQSGFDNQSGSHPGESADGPAAPGIDLEPEGDEPVDLQAEKQRLMAGTATLDVFA